MAKKYPCVCQHCGKTFYLDKSRINRGKNKYCSIKCSSESRINKIKVNCAYCGKEKEVTPSNYNNNKTKKFFCNGECQAKYRSKVNTVYKICEICGKEFSVIKSKSHRRFCSMKCQGVWQSKNLVGENANNFSKNCSVDDHILKCEWCGKDYFCNSPSKIDKSRFCSDKCRQEWYAKVWSQRDEWREESRKRAVDMLESGLFSKTLSEPQKIINDLLDELEIKYENEKNFKYFSADNYLLDYDLVIEVMGSYWHCDHRKYPTINYDMQVRNIRSDKSKHTYIKNNYSIEILYLWENDIINNLDICRKLILDYINNNGKLENYHSFNYIEEDISIPYMEWDSDDLRKIIDIKVIEKMSMKQHDKWITFSCEYCGKEKEELISHYNKKKHHYCSNKCRTMASRVKYVDVACEFCGKSFAIIPSKYHKSKSKEFFCNRDCWKQFRKNNV